MSAGYWLAWAVLSALNAGLLSLALWLRFADRRTIESVRASLRSRGAQDPDCTCTPARLHAEDCPEATGAAEDAALAHTMQILRSTNPSSGVVMEVEQIEREIASRQHLRAIRGLRSGGMTGRMADPYGRDFAAPDD